MSSGTVPCRKGPAAPPGTWVWTRVARGPDRVRLARPIPSVCFILPLSREPSHFGSIQLAQCGGGDRCEPKQNEFSCLLPPALSLFFIQLLLQSTLCSPIQQIAMHSMERACEARLPSPVTDRSSQLLLNEWTPFLVVGIIQGKHGPRGSLSTVAGKPLVQESHESPAAAIKCPHLLGALLWPRDASSRGSLDLAGARLGPDSSSGEQAARDPCWVIDLSACLRETFWMVCACPGVKSL